MTDIDVNKITSPMRAERDRLTAEADQMDAKADSIEEAARNEATQILQKGGEESAPFRREAKSLRAHANRFEVLIGREEQEAAQAALSPAAPTLTDGSLDVSGHLGEPEAGS